MPDDSPFGQANGDTKGAFNAFTGGNTSPPPGQATTYPYPYSTEPIVATPLPPPAGQATTYPYPYSTEPIVATPLPPAGAAGAPSTAKQASDWAAGQKPPAAPATPTSYNQGILDSANAYEKNAGKEVPYLYGGGTTDGVDCSHYVASSIGGADPKFDASKDYKSTAQMSAYLGDKPPKDGMYEKVDPKDVKAGDIVMYNGHTGIVTEPVDPETGKGKFIGSQSSTGVAEADFGEKAGYWGNKKPVTGYLRYKGKGDGKGESATKGADAKASAGKGKGDASKNDAKNAKPQAKKVTNNDREIAHKKSNHIATSVQPTDIHLPVGSGVPKPFMNLQNTSKLYAGSKMTFIEKVMIWLKDTGRVGPTDNTHPSHLPGIISGTYQGPARAITASMDTKVEGQFVVRERDITFQNTNNTIGQVKKAPPPPAKAGKGKGKAAPAKAKVKRTFPPEVIKAAQESQRATGVPASITMAQWALESGWGKHMPEGSNNPFGIKARKGDPGVDAMTTEDYGKGIEHVSQKFRKFDSLDDAFTTHGELISTKKPYVGAMAVKDDPDKFADKLQGVYATDTEYASKLKGMMGKYDLYQYNTLPPPTPPPGK